MFDYDDEVGGFEKIKKNPNKKTRQDSKRIPKDQRKQIKKERKQQKMYQSLLTE
tara:strand:- start:7906 stop:8067 length:162 start_codon:yes stop_codon:yes gene_type:complete